MFQASQDFLKDKNIIPFLSFKEQAEHTVELVKDKRDSITNNAGEVVEGVSYLVKENGELKKFFTSAVSLVNKLINYSAGDTVKIRLKRVKTPKGFRSTYEVIGEETKEPEEEEMPEEEQDVPEEEISLKDIPF